MVSVSQDSKRFYGIHTALITPMHQGQIDWASLESLVSDQIDQGVNGLIVNGTTGESPTLSLEEIQKLVEFSKAFLIGKNFQGPLIVGTGSNSTSRTIELTKKAQSWGADAALVVAPYYNKPPQRGLIEHFQGVAESCSLPIILYNVPGRSVVSLSLETIVELSKHPNIVGIKEASGDLDFFRKLVPQLAEDFVLLSGDDATCFEFMASGGHGVISVCSHLIGREMAELFSFLSGEKKKAAESFQRYLPLIEALYLESNPIPIKQALYLTGLIRSPELRLPLSTMAEGLTFQLKERLIEYGLVHES